MKNFPDTRLTAGGALRRGMTLIELTVVILVFLILVGVLFVGANGWKNGADRSACIMNQYKVQEGVRSFANVNNIAMGDDTSALTPPIDLETAVVAEGFVEFYPSCPSDGVYTRNGNIMPPLGQLYMTCSLAASKGHEPREIKGW
ncbi:MAG: type II secretion system protein [Akkermansiaceae bacterium]|nr:type II secretion system protein [Akkermansiaceae bacterium]NNM31301.1 type II secretion system protein [Akkermansiaceae bacterium]